MTNLQVTPGYQGQGVDLKGTLIVHAISHAIPYGNEGKVLQKFMVSIPGQVDEFEATMFHKSHAEALDTAVNLNQQVEGTLTFSSREYLPQGKTDSIRITGCRIWIKKDTLTGQVPQKYTPDQMREVGKTLYG